MWAKKEEFDPGSYPMSNALYDATNVFGKFKDDASGQAIIQLVGLKHKMYSYQTLNDPSPDEGAFTTMKRAKRIQWAAIAKLRHEQTKAQLVHPVGTYMLNCRIGFTFTTSMESSMDQMMSHCTEQ